MTYPLCRSWLFRVGCWALALLCAAGARARAATSEVSAAGFAPDINGVVNAIVRQSDGKLVAGGAFSQVQSTSTNPVTRNNIARFNRDGTVDSTFAPSLDGPVKTLVVQADGKILAGGTFSSRIVRFNANGTVDSTFDTTLGGYVIAGINALAVQADGKIVIGAMAKPPLPVTSEPTFRLLRLNADGTVDTSFKTDVNSIVNAVAVQSDGKILAGGGFTSVTPNGGAAVTRNHLLRLNSDGSLDTAFDPSVNNSVLTIAVQLDGGVIIGGAFSQVTSANAGVAFFRNRLARLTRDGTVDSSYAPTVNGSVVTAVLQSDGRLLIGGAFSGVTPSSLDSVVTRYYVARLNFDGTLDTTFDPSPNAAVNAIVVEDDGRVVLGGNFTQVRFGAIFGGAPVNRMVRVAADGSADVPFSSDLAGRVLVSAVQPDGKIVIGGTFISVGGFTHFRLARLNADGSVDNTFNPSFNSTVQSLAVQSDGKVLVGGTFTSVNETSILYLARLNSDGTLDKDFNLNISGGSVLSLAVQPDGKIILGGNFTSLQAPQSDAAVIRAYVARVNPDGTLDEDFDPYANGPINAIQVQSDGKIVLGGAFTVLQPNADIPYARYYLARVNADGTIDRNFVPHTNGAVNALALQSDGKIVVGGTFTGVQPLDALEQISRNRIMRINADGTVDEGFDPNLDNAVLTLAVQSDGKILVGGGFTLVEPNGASDPIGRNFVTRLNADGAVDTTWDVAPNYRVGDQVTFITLQPDGKALLAGDFTSLRVNGVGSPHVHFARVNADGTLDPAFKLGLADRSAVQIKALATGISSRIVAGGSFTNLNGATSANLARFNYDGTPDFGFMPNPNGTVNAIAVVPGATSPTGAVSWIDTDGDPISSAAALSSISGEVRASAVTADGKILLGGLFSRSDGNAGANLVLVTTTGELVSTFTPDVSGAVSAIAVQPDGKILIGGAFTAVNSGGRNYIARLNSDGTLDTSFNPNANGAVLAVAVQSDGKILIGGEFTSLQPNGASSATSRAYLARLNSDGSVDSNFLMDLNARVSVIALQSDGKALVGGRFTSIKPTGVDTPVDRLRLIRLKTDGTIDADFDPAPDDEVLTLAVQADGNILAGGAFRQAYTDTSPVTVNYIVRLTEEGKIDPSFAATANSSVHVIQLAPDGSILVGGSFTAILPAGSLVTVARSHIARFSASGVLDTDFTPSFNGAVNTLVIGADGTIVAGGSFSAIEAAESIVAGGAFTTVGGNAANYLALMNSDGSLVPSFVPNPDAPVNAIARLADGRLLIGGSFTKIGDTARTYLARLSADGSLDGTFNATLNGQVRTIAPQADGNVIVGGAFTTAGGVARPGLARFTSTGVLDASFAPFAGSVEAVSIDAVAVQADGKILVGGRFQQIGGGARAYLARLTPGGTLDSSFTADVNGNVTGIAVQTDGHVLIVGSFTEVNGSDVPNFARLNADGSTDVTLTGATDGEVDAFALEVDGRAVIGGRFATVANEQRFNIARISLGGVSVQSVVVSSDLSTITWQRSGAAPEISSASFETSPDGQSWKLLGSASRVGTTSDWRLDNLDLADGANVFVRARGIPLTGPATSSGLVETTQYFYTTGTPRFTSPTTVNATSGGTFFYGIAATSSPTYYDATGLPAGLAIDHTTGLISGQPTQTGTFSVTLTATNAGGTSSTTLTLIVSAPSSTPTARLMNLSSRAGITSANGPLINGFVITGSSARSVLLRGAGPALADLGVQSRLSKPILTVYDAQGHAITSVQAWGGSQALTTLFSQLGAFPFAADSADAATVVTLDPGVYTVHLSAGNGSDGVGLSEIYDSAAVAGDPTRLVNLSSRGRIGTGENVMIAGFVIEGNGTRRVLVRAAGPALVALGVNAAAAASDPTLSVYAGGTEIARNDNWGTPVTVDAGYPAASASDLSTAATAAGAFPLDSGSKDAAIILTLPAGTYTAQASGVSGTTGEALVEIYELPDAP